MPDPEDVHVEVERGEPFNERRKPPFEERLMRALSAIHGDLTRIADSLEQISNKFDGAGQIDPVVAATAKLADLLGGKKRRGGR